MKSRAILTTAMVLVFCAAAAAGESAAADKVVAGGNEFAFDIYCKLAADGEGNLFFSPTSIHTALAMTYAGARGRTEQQMGEVLHFTPGQEKLHPAFERVINSLNSPRKVTVRLRENGKWKVEKQDAYQLTVANALWGQQGYPWKDDFIKLTRVNYGAGLHEVDFAKTEAAREKINKWVEQQTKDKIKDLIPSGALNDLTRLVLTNAMYFKSQWAEQFKQRNTKDKPFHLGGGESVETPMMYQQEKFGYMETDDFQVLRMAYKAGDLSMVVLLPREVDGLAELQKQLTAAKLDKWLDGIKPAEVKVTLPKFKFTSRFSLAKKLAEMGMANAFSPEKADFSGMTTAEKLFISDVIHKAFVAVDEKGTEAAAATAVTMMATAMPVPQPEPKVFNADHPFMFLIRHNETGSILFLGRVVNPKGE